MPENNERKKDFLRSLSDLNADGIRAKKKKKRRVIDTVLDNLRFLLMGVCVVVFAFSVYNIGKSFADYDEQNRIYDAIGDFVMDKNNVGMMFADQNMQATPDHDNALKMTDDDLSDYTNAQVVNKEYARVRVKLLNLKNRYPDLYGWISVSGTNINYPIMQTNNNDYYLNHSYSGSLLGAGAIFADFTCEPKLMQNKNLVVYGHHMSNSSMFHQLDNFLKESFFMNNGKVIVYTLDGMYTYQIYSIYETHKYYPYITTYFSNDEKFIEFGETSEQKSIYRKGKVHFDGNSKLLTLSTCNNRFSDGRLAVHAIMVDAYNNPNS